MSWWNMRGLNPKFKDFTEKHPNATVLGMSWALYWRMTLVVIAVEIVLFALMMVAGLVFGFGHHGGRGDWGHERGPGYGMPMQGKLNINVVCEQSLAYTTFTDASSTEGYLAECKAGQHPEVIEQYKATHGYGDGGSI